MTWNHHRFGPQTGTVAPNVAHWWENTRAKSFWSRLLCAVFVNWVESRERISRKTITRPHGKQAGGWTNILSLSISFNPSAYLRPEEIAFFRFMWLVNLQLSSAVISLWRGFPMQQIANVHNWGQVCRFPGKTRDNFRSFTSKTKPRMFDVSTGAFLNFQTGSHCVRIAHKRSLE